MVAGRPVHTNDVFLVRYQKQKPSFLSTAAMLEAGQRFVESVECGDMRMTGFRTREGFGEKTRGSQRHKWDPESERTAKAAGNVLAACNGVGDRSVRGWAGSVVGSGRVEAADDDDELVDRWRVRIGRGYGCRQWSECAKGIGKQDNTMWVAIRQGLGNSRASNNDLTSS
ncbi:hypothetical protein AXG93_4548s1090 [Marchantia polymorpha subsp. ruderalis]|uniref:Uncharacterized protein n=1 Tax=Marchantia polymorpha subsp. ruderalis TaxID=1480154 RepID=A0A176WAI4_MARPO|nr:hypothetical protein AXG93_4548s1090 [Marchantia polymorpha subsp. ruderalis]